MRSNPEKTKKTTAKESGEERELTLAEGLSELEDILRKMEDGGLPLEETFDLYKQGLSRLRQCNSMIDRVEKELEVLEEGGEE